MSLAALLHAAQARFPNKPSVIVDKRTLSYSELDLQARRFAHKLMAFGVRSGDRVALHMYNSLELAVSYFACFMAGAIAVPVNTRMKAAEIKYVLEHSGASTYCGQAELFREIDDLRPCLPGIQRFVVDGRDVAACPRPLVGAELPAVTAHELAAILYTSGSTARPKGVAHTHGSLLHAARACGIENDDVVILTTPMVHGAGLMTFLAGVGVAATHVVIGRFDPDAILDAIAQHRGSYLLAMPVMCRALIATQRRRPRDVSSGRFFLAGGDAVPPALQDEFARCFGQSLHEGFGTTETGLIAANWPGTEPRVGSFGRAVPGVDVAVVDTDGRRALGEAEGEMIVRSAGNMVGYWNDREATQRALKDGWFRTGDIVRRDSDGYLWFRGRSKEIIVRGGSNVSPQEVEAVLYQNAGVREAGVVGIPDATWGERLVAFVSRRSGHAVTAGELVSFVRARLADYKTPEEVVFVDELPNSAAGKVSRRALLDIYFRTRSPELTVERQRRAGKKSEIMAAPSGLAHNPAGLAKA